MGIGRRRLLWSLGCPCDGGFDSQWCGHGRIRQVPARRPRWVIRGGATTFLSATFRHRRERGAIGWLPVVAVSVAAVCIISDSGGAGQPAIVTTGLVASHFEDARVPPAGHRPGCLLVVAGRILVAGTAAIMVDRLVERCLVPGDAASGDVAVLNRQTGDRRCIPSPASDQLGLVPVYDRTGDGHRRQWDVRVANAIAGQRPLGKRITPRGRRDLLLLAAILLLAAVLRIGWPRLTEFKFSEARLEALALELTREGRLPLVGVPSSAGFDHSPISVYLYVPAFLFTTDPIPATIYGGLVGVAAVALCWWLARQWPGGGRWAALVAALLFAVSPWSVAFSRKIWQVAFVPLLTVAFVGLLVSVLVEGKRWSLAWALVIYAVLVQVHPSAVSLGLTLLLWLVIFWRQIRLGPLLVGGVLGALTTVPFFVHQVQSGWPVLAAYRALPEAMWDLTAVRLAWEAVTGRGIHALAGDAYPFLDIVPQLGWLLNLVGWLAVGAALWLAWRMVAGWRAVDVTRQRSARVDLILLSWFVAPVVFNLRYSLDLHLHFFALVMPAAYFIIGRAVEVVFGPTKPRVPGEPRPAVTNWVLRIASLAGLGLLVVVQVVVLVLVARFVATHDTPGGFGTPLGFYLDAADLAVSEAGKHDAAEVLVVGQGNSIVVDESPAIFDVLLRDRVTYRFVDGHSTALFPPHPALALMTSEAGEATAWYRSWPAVDLGNGYQLVTLDGSWPQEGLESVAGPRVFENGVEMQGYAWDSAPRGGKFWLLWQILWLSPNDTHFFVHLLDEGGQQWGQQDIAGYPNAYRRKGDRIVSKFDINAEFDVPPGPYWVRAGLYVYPAIENVWVVDGTGEPVTDVVVVGPLDGRQ